MSHTNGPEPSPEQAQAALDRASGMKVTTPRDVRILAGVALGVGVALGLMIVMIKVTSGNPVAFWSTMLVYLIGVGALVMNNARVGSAPRGYAVRYGLGIAGASLVYGISVFCFPDGGASWPSTIALALITAAPAALAAFSISRLVRK